MSLALFDWECSRCGFIEERLEERDVDNVKCSQCSGVATKVFPFRGQMFGEESSWIRTVLDVVDKHDGSPVTREFLQTPTRSNMRRWMKEKGIRHLEDGEKNRPGEGIDPRKHTDEIMKMRYNRRRIEI